MGKVNIDLGALFGLLTKTPTAANSVNPDYQPSESIPYYDPVSGQTSGVMPNNTPFNAPSNWQRLVHPEQSNVIDSLNSSSIAKPIASNQDLLNTLSQRAGVIARRPVSQQGIYSPDQEAAMGIGDINETPYSINNANAQMIYGANGGPALTAAGMHNEAARAIAENRNAAIKAGVAGELGTPTTEAGAENAGAHLQQIYNTGRADVLPSEFSRQLAENRLGTAQATGELGLLPSRLSLEGTQLNTQIPIAEQARENLSYTLPQMRTEAIRNLAESQRMPIPPRYTDLIDQTTGNITLSKDPIGANPFALQFAGINDLTSMTGKPQSFKGSDGKTYTLPGNSLITGKGYNPLPETPPVSGGPSIGGGSNNVTNNVPHNTEGSMNPSVPTASSSTTLKPSISSSIPFTTNDGTNFTLQSAQSKAKALSDSLMDKMMSGQKITEEERQHLMALMAAAKQ